MHQLFDITKIMFEQPHKWKEVSKADKQRNFFPINRRLAIKYPMQANALQILDINQSGVIDFWFDFISKQYNKTPGWMFTTGVKKSKKQKEEKLNISEKMINDYVNHMRVDRKSIYDAIKLFPKETEKELKKFQKIIS